MTKNVPVAKQFEATREALDVWLKWKPGDEVRDKIFEALTELDAAQERISWLQKYAAKWQRLAADKTEANNE